MATLDRYSSIFYQEFSTLGRIVDAFGPDVSVVSISGGSTILVEAFCQYLSSGYHQKLIDYPSFDLRLFKQCLQRTASSVFGISDGLAMTEFIVNRLKDAETRDWMSSRPALKKAILTNDLSMPHLVDVVANIMLVATVASRSVIGQGLSCFCPAFVVGGDNVALFQLFNKL